MRKSLRAIVNLHNSQNRRIVDLILQYRMRSAQLQITAELHELQNPYFKSSITSFTTFSAVKPNFSSSTL